DAVLLDAPKDDFKPLAHVEGKRVVTIEFGADEKAWAEADFLKSVRERLLAAAGDTRRKQLEAFVAQREPEKREESTYVANYEKRPEPLTFQHPFSTKGSMERTQVPADMRLELFASEPDITKPIA